MFCKMRRFINRKCIAAVFVAFALIAAVAGGLSFHNGAASTHKAHADGVGGKKIGAGNDSPFCKTLGKSIQASQAAQAFCKGPSGYSPNHKSHPAAKALGTNVDAANPAEDVSPAGVQAYGQSEVSTAAAGSYVVEAWNDSTGFFSTCGAPMNKEELTGFAFSNDGGKTFTDLGG